MNILQSLILPAPWFPGDLYFRITSSAKKTPYKRTIFGAIKNNRLQLKKRDVLSTDTYFGSFYAAYWKKFTEVKDFSLSLSFTGMGQISVFEDDGRNVSLLLKKKVSSDGNIPVLLPIEARVLFENPFTEDIQTSRIFVEFRASQDSEIKRIDFVSANNQRSDISLSIGLCTFNQEKYFAKTLARIDILANSEAALKKVYIVNQGQPFQSDEILALLKNPKFELIEQRNLGGCGGFTRSLFEAQSAEQPTSHHLLMDDDIVLDENLIRRSLRFLSFASKDIVLGGAMFDAMRPSHMYEAGAFLRADNTIIPYCHNVDMADPGQLWHFNKVVETDYNAWWFCIVPMKSATACGLPAPVFIRGDDFEYGQRLARHGVPTVTLPGVAVWHEPFYAKPLGWQTYYDMRNRLIFGATYPEKVTPLSVMRIAGLLVTPLLSHQYLSTALRLKAVRDFLDGPEQLFAMDAEDRHKEVSQLAKQYGPPKLDNEKLRSVPLTTGKPGGTTTLALMKSYATRSIALLLLPYGRKRRVFLEADAHPRSIGNSTYVQTNGPRSFHLLFTPKRRLFVKMLRQSIALILEYRARRAAVEQVWLSGIDSYRSKQYWQDIFK